jgi:hypothetical protein
MKRFSDKSSQEVLAMVAFQFAKTFVVLNKQAEATSTSLESLERELDNILLDVEAKQPSFELPLDDSNDDNAPSLF